ncbi:fibronectin type III domain-containing protein [Methanogenium sp. S4BF]|uniref:fibronectin type III domain-containing protein n=1 Tax=Methanogenium sp. S4BF TaxID=1789226 RepID=UPI002415CF3B|nr:fibronectin type III domain-containing protein [Methanogenium sp. S4BF]WFN34712.1 fibronectin type III domain-containing protein [Methanogenium sp. S4BF]
MTYRVYYDETIATAVATETLANGGVAPVALASGMTFTVSTVSGIPNGAANLFNITFTSLKNDGSSTELGIVPITAVDVNIPPTNLLGAITIANGTFTTKDDVAPVIVNITTPSNVGKNFQITGYINEVGGLPTATATLTNGTYTSAPYALTLTDIGNGYYTYAAAASWDVFEDGITLTVNAEDPAGHSAIPKQTVLNVKNVGFSNPSPVGYINTVPVSASVFMSQMDTTTVNMTIGDGSTSTDLVVSIVGDYAYGALPVLGDGIYWVNATGTDTISAGEHYLNWTYTLDTTSPLLNAMVTDSDGDGYIEANEVLTFDWTVSSDGVSGFKNVSIVEPSTGDVLWTSAVQVGSAQQTITTGNRDLSFRAYDNAGNFAAYDFHLYNNYVAWVNSTKMGTISGLDTEFTSMVDMDRTASSMITLYNGRSISLPDIGTVTRQVENVGQVTSDTYVTVDNRANATYAGTDTYQTLWAYEPSDIIDFRVIAPAITRANIVMMEANESYLNDLIDSGSAGGINYTQLVKNSAYIFIDGGWTKITVNPDGSYTQDIQRGNPLTASGNITQMMKNPANQVDISSGFRMSTDCVAFDAITTPDVGDYALAALAFDGDRIGVIAMMPVVILETTDQGTISADTVVVNGTFDASVNSNCKYFEVMLYRDTEYNATAMVDFSTLNYDMVTVDLSAGGAATERLWHNIYITPGAGKYASAKNANTLTFNVSGLETGSYKAVLAGLSNNGTAQLLGVHDLTIIDSTVLNITNVGVTTGTTAASVTWTTNIAANSTVEYGTTVAYGNTMSDAAYVLAHSMIVTGLSPSTVYHYRIVSYDASGNMAVTGDATFITKSSGGGGGGGGGGGFVPTTTPVQTFTTTGQLQTDINGVVQNGIVVSSADGLASVSVGEGVTALNANGLPLEDITIQATDGIPSPGSSAFTFAGHAVELGPSGATFSPAIELTFQLTEEEWNKLAAGESFVIKWYNEALGEWEDIPTSVNPYNHTVIGEISHFSTFALFKQIVETPTPVVTQTPAPTDVPGETPVPTETGGEGTQTGGFPWIWVIVVIVLIAVIGGGYYYMQQKK